MQVRKQQLELDMEQQTFQIGKGIHQGCILSLCLFNLYAEYLMSPELARTHVHRVSDAIQPSHLILCRPLLLPPSNFLSIRVFSNDSALCIRWLKYRSFSFSINPSNEYSGLISFRMDWLEFLAVQGTLKSSPTSQFKTINSSVLSFLYSPTLTSIHDYWENHSLD